MAEKTVTPRTAHPARRVRRWVASRARHVGIPLAHLLPLGLGFLVAVAMLLIFGALAEDVVERDGLALDIRASFFYLSDVVGYSTGLFWLISVAFAMEGRRLVSRDGEKRYWTARVSPYDQ